MSKFLFLFAALLVGVSGNNFNVSISKFELENEQNLSFISHPISQELVRFLSEYKNFHLEGRDFGKISAVINNYTDVVLSNIKQLMIHQGFDPFKMNDMKTGFNYHFLFIRYYGEMKLTDGWLEDLSTLHRAGDVVADYSPTTKKLQITVPVGFDDMVFNYRYSAKLMGLGPSGGVEGKISDFRLRIKLGFDFEKLRASLDEFTITNTHTIYVHFTGHILIDWIVDLLTNVTTLLFKKLIVWIMEVNVRGNLKLAVDTLNTFLEHIFNETSTHSNNLTKDLLFVLQ